MAAGQPFSSLDSDAWIKSVLSSDLLMQEYCPGGFWPINPPQISGSSSWDSSYSYSELNGVRGSDAIQYYSLQESNAGHDPVSSSAWWAKVYPMCRWWVQSPGLDVSRQDGQMSRVESLPKICIAIVDKQFGGVAEFVNGSLGSGNLKKAYDRLYVLLHGRQQSFGGIQYLMGHLAALSPISSGNSGDWDVELPRWFQIWAQ